ncbi:MAG: TetR/AcrR family transcriptional regulator [Bacilli bacterium]|nr:TetR/AcrR family transcriptional regulator [Bacilli bacterium]
MDRRVQYTKKVITETFINLLEKKDISSITVTKLCSLADINRATFYRYYLDVYDLLKQIENDFILEIRNSSSMESLPKNSIYDFTIGILEIFLLHKKLVKILFNTNRNVYFLNEVLEVAYEKCMTLWEERMPESSEAEVEYALVFAFNGALGVINYWIKNDFNDNIEDIANLITDCCKYGIRKYLGSE